MPSFTPSENEVNQTRKLSRVIANHDWSRYHIGLILFFVPFFMQSCGFQILLTILMISCSGSLTVRAQELQIWFSDAYDTKTYYPNNYGNKKTSIADVQRSNAMLIYAALVSDGRAHVFIWKQLWQFLQSCLYWSRLSPANFITG